jgi:hypothetical protein
MFRKDGSELVPALTIEAIHDFADRRSGHFRTIAWCEVSSHDAYARELFIDFLRVIRNTRCAMYGRSVVGCRSSCPGKTAYRNLSLCQFPASRFALHQGEASPATAGRVA